MSNAFPSISLQVAQLTDHEVQLGGLATRLRSSGDGTLGTVLMLHSLGLDRLAYDPLRAVLDQGWRVACFDQYAHGSAVLQTEFSLQDCVDATMAAIAILGPAPIHMVGHSMGGAIAALAASQAGVNVASLSLVASPPAGGPAFKGRGDLIRQGGTGAVIPSTLERWFGTGIAALQAGEAMAYARLTLQSMRVEGFARSWDELAKFKGYWGLGERLPPTICIASAEDASTPPHLMQLIIRACAPAHIPLSVIEAAGHMVPLTRPEAVGQILQSFWATEKH